ncbi:MAG: slr1658 superfamily regulator [Bacteroidota bacterium]
MKEQILGDYELTPDYLPAEGDLKLTVKPIDLITHWRRCGMIADFVAEYYESGETEIDKNIVSTVFNELIENASKYSTKRDSEIHIEVKRYNRILKMQVSNISNQSYFESLINRLTHIINSKNLDELFYNEMLKKANGDKQSEIGLLIMIKDYQIKLGAKLAEKGEDLFEITVQAYYFIDNHE